MNMWKLKKIPVQQMFPLLMPQVFICRNTHGNVIVNLTLCNVDNKHSYRKIKKNIVCQQKKIATFSELDRVREIRNSRNESAQMLITN